MSGQLWKFADQITIGGFRADEVTSALQKAISRGLEEESLFWASELDLSGWGGYAFRRLRLIASEDVGVADPYLPATIAALYDAWLEVTKREKAGRGVGNGALYLAHAVMLLARAPKSRAVDNAVNLMYSHRELVKRPIPDWAVDHHTAEGRRRRRSERSTYDASYGIARQVLPDPYLERSHPWMKDDQVRRHAEPHERHPAEEAQ